MVPVIAANGASFRGAFQYYCHDRQGRTTERIEWAQTINMLTDCVTKAWKVMAYTAKHQDRLKEVSGQKATGAKIRKPVFAFSLSWAPEQKPDKVTMLEAAKRSLAALGLSEHQAIIVAHNDRPHRHVHIVANTVHPLTGLVAKLKFTKQQLSDFALNYEKEMGKIYCPQREANHQKREAGKMTRYCDPHIAEAWTSTTTGQGFMEALEAKGYRLAQGRKRLVVIDPHGKAHNPMRHLQDVKAKDIHERLRFVDLSRLPDADRPADASNQNAVPAAAEKDNNLKERLRLVQMQAETLAQKHRHTAEALALQQRRRVAFSKERLVAFYQLPQKKQELMVLKHKIMEAPWWKRLLRLTRSDKEALEEKVQDYRKTVRENRETMSHIADQNRQERHELRERQAKEMQDFALYAARVRSGERTIATEKVKIKENGLDVRQDYNAASRDNRREKNDENVRSRRINDPTLSYQR